MQKGTNELNQNIQILLVFIMFYNHDEIWNMKSVGLFTLDFVLQGHKLLKYMGTIGNPLYSKNRLFSNINFDFAPTHFMNSA